MSQVEHLSGQGLIISGEEIPFAAYQAIYHKLTRRVEKIRREYRDGYRITLDDFANLHERLTQIIQQYNVQGRRCQVSRIAKDSYSNTYSSFEKFRMCDLSTLDCTSRLNYEFDFLAVLPSEIQEAKDAAQRFKVEIRFSQNFIEKDDPKVPFFIKDLLLMGSLDLAIEYSDYAVAQAIESTVNGWIKTLQVVRDSSAVKIAFELEEFVNGWFSPALQLTAFAAGSYGLARMENVTPATVGSAILFFYGLAYLAYAIGDFIVRRFYSALRSFAPSPAVLLTRGDRERLNNLEKKQRKSKAVVGGVFVLGVVAIAVNLFSTWLYNALFP